MADRPPVPALVPWDSDPPLNQAGSAVCVRSKPPISSLPTCRSGRICFAAVLCARDADKGWRVGRFSDVESGKRELTGMSAHMTRVNSQNVGSGKFIDRQKKLNEPVFINYELPPFK